MGADSLIAVLHITAHPVRLMHSVQGEMKNHALPRDAYEAGSVQGRDT